MVPIVFADTFYWLALTHPRERGHTAARQWAATNRSTRIVTTDEVLSELLNALAGAGPMGRAHAVASIHDIRHDSHVDVLPQTRAEFDTALGLYEARPDKGYSLTDCRSMNALRSLGIAEVLTNDRHFSQEGFTILFP